jgi:hypothetical protein
MFNFMIPVGLTGCTGVAWQGRARSTLREPTFFLSKTAMLSIAIPAISCWARARIDLKKRPEYAGWADFEHVQTVRPQKFNLQVKFR